jgi:hypothetical protein
MWAEPAQLRSQRLASRRRQTSPSLEPTLPKTDEAERKEPLLTASEERNRIVHSDANTNSYSKAIRGSHAKTDADSKADSEIDPKKNRVGKNFSQAIAESEIEPDKIG